MAHVTRAIVLRFGQKAATRVIVVVCLRLILWVAHWVSTVLPRGCLCELLIDHFLLFNDHVQLHVALVLSTNVEGVHSYVAIASSPHAYSGRSAAHNDCRDREHKQEHGMSLFHWVACITQMHCSDHLYDLSRGLFHLGQSHLSSAHFCLCFAFCGALWFALSLNFDSDTCLCKLLRSFCRLGLYSFWYLSWNLGKFVGFLHTDGRLGSYFHGFIFFGSFRLFFSLSLILL